MTYLRDDALLAELTGAPQGWLRRCRVAVAAGATGSLLDPGPEIAVLARHSAARWKSFDAGHDPLDEEAEEPDAQGRRVTADVSAARALAGLAEALTGTRDIAAACAEFLAHAERAGLHSAGTQLLPAGPVTSADTPCGAVVRHLLGQGGRPARGYAILAALELAGQRPGLLRTARARVLFVTIAGGGQVGTLRLEQVRGGPSGLHPDPARMGFLQADPEFSAGLADAWRASRLADTDACVLWSVTGTGLAPANDINGPSLGAAIAVALDDLAPRRRLLRRLRPRTLDPDCAVTAGLSGTTLTPVGGYAGKLAAAHRAGLRVVVAEAGHADARAAAPPGYPDRIAAARTVSEAVAAARTRRNVAPVLVSIAALLAVLLAVVSVTGLVRARAENATARAESNSRLLAAAARGTADYDPALAQLLALAAYRTSSTVDARSALLESSAAEVPIRLTPGRAEPGPDAPRLATTADGDLIAVGESDGTVELARVTEAGVDRFPRFPTDSGRIHALALSPDQRWLVVAGERRTLLWDIGSPDRPRLLTQLSLDGGLPSTAAFGPSRALLAIGTHGGTVHTWRLGTDPARPIPLPVVGAQGQWAQVALSDRLLVAAVSLPSPDGWTTTVRGWRTESLHRAPVFERQLTRTRGAQARSAMFGADGTVLAVGLNPGEVVRWRFGTDPSRPEPLPSVPRGANEYFDVAVDRDGRTAAVVGGDAHARIIALDTGAVVAAFPSGAVAGARFLRGGRSLVTAGLDHAVHVFTLPGPTVPVGALTLVGLPHDRPDQPAALRPAALAAHLRALSRVAVGDLGVDGDPAGLLDTVVVGPDGTRAATLTERAIQVWDLTGTTPTPHGPPIDNGIVDVRGLAFAPDGTLAIGRGLTESVEFWDVGAGREIRGSLRFGHGYPTALAFGPDWHLLAVGSHRTGEIRVYDLRAGPTAPPVTAISDARFIGPDLSLALSSDGLLAIGAAAGTFVHAGDGTPLPTPSGSSAGAVAFSHDGTLLAVDDTGGRILLWDYTDPHRPTIHAAIDTRKRHWQKTMLTFAGGTTLVQSAADGTIRQWHTDVEARARALCASATAPITAEEWARVLPGRPAIAPC